MIKLSRSKLERFLECQRCFWLETRKDIKRPPSLPYTINSSIDFLLKQEFDEHRAAGTQHPIIVAAGIDAVPYEHSSMDMWRHNFTGVQFDHEATGFHVFGAVDDIWVDKQGNLIVVDYKSTGSVQHHIYDSYKRQMEVYQWLLRQNGFPVSDRGYFVFARVDKGATFHTGGDLSAKGRKSLPGKHALLPFDIFVEGLDGDSSWVEGELYNARRVYDLPSAPAANSSCVYCKYAADNSSQF
jgi:hypothetical protein